MLKHSLRIQIHSALVNLHVDLILAQHQVLLIDLQRRLLVDEVPIEQINRRTELSNLFRGFDMQPLEHRHGIENRSTLFTQMLFHIVVDVVCK